MKISRVALAMAMALLALFAGVMPASAAAPKPHEDPDVATWVFDGASLLNKFAEALDSLSSQDSAGINALQDQSVQANIPPDMRQSANSFFSSAGSLAEPIPAIQAAIETARTLLAESRPDDARDAVVAATENLNKAYMGLRAMETATADAGRWWGVAAVSGGPLRQAYDDVQAKLARLRSRLDALGKMGQGVIQQADILSAAAHGASGSELADALQASSDGAIPPDVLARIVAALSGGKALTPTGLTLAISPQSAFVGDEVGFQGTLAAAGVPLSGRTVSLLLNGSLEAAVRTDDTGWYSGLVRLPYQYGPKATLQAIYSPQGIDLGVYLGCSSSETDVAVLFYSAALTLQVPDQVYPGQNMQLKGRFDYGADQPPAGRELLVYWDNDVVDQEVVSPEFTIEVPVDASTSMGRHHLAAYAPADGRYAPSAAGKDTEVTKVAPAIDVHTQRLLLLPMSLNVDGRVYSQFGPLKNALLTVRMGDWQTSTLSRSDGSFEVRLGTGMSPAFVAGQNLSVGVSPDEPWYKESSSDVRLTVISPVNLAGLVLALAFLTMLGLRWVKRRPEQVATIVPGPVTVVDLNQRQPVRDDAVFFGGGSGSWSVLVTLYREVLRLVQGVTAVALGPNRTLREFAQEASPKLGPLGGHFREFTAQVERLLYSRHNLRQGEAAISEELGKTLKEGLKSENT